MKEINLAISIVNMMTVKLLVKLMESHTGHAVALRGGVPRAFNYPPVYTYRRFAVIMISMVLSMVNIIFSACPVRLSVQTVGLKFSGSCLIYHLDLLNFFNTYITNQMKSTVDPRLVDTPL